MPYIHPGIKACYEPELSTLLNHIHGGTATGALNYIITKILKAALGEMSYTRANELLGVLEAAKLEFYRRKVAPYEDLKISENGDVY